MVKLFLTSHLSFMHSLYIQNHHVLFMFVTYCCPILLQTGVSILLKRLIWKKIGLRAALLPETYFFRPNGSIALTSSLCQSVSQAVSGETLVSNRQSKQFATATTFKLCFPMGRIEPLTLGTTVSNYNH